MHQIVVIPGDCIGPEIVEAAVRGVEATGVSIQWGEVTAGQCAVPQYGEPVPEAALEAIRNTGVALKGPMTHVVGSGFPSPNVTLRVRLDLFANVRLARTIRGAKSPFFRRRSRGDPRQMEGTFFSIFLIESPVVPVEKAVVPNHQNPPAHALRGGCDLKPYPHPQNSIGIDSKCIFSTLPYNQ